jgi:hypothetical protein
LKSGSRVAREARAGSCSAGGVAGGQRTGFVDQISVGQPMVRCLSANLMFLHGRVLQAFPEEDLIKKVELSALCDRSDLDHNLGPLRLPTALGGCLVRVGGDQ